MASAYLTIFLFGVRNGDSRYLVASPPQTRPKRDGKRGASFFCVCVCVHDEQGVGTILPAMDEDGGGSRKESGKPYMVPSAVERSVPDTKRNRDEGRPADGR